MFHVSFPLQMGTCQVSCEGQCEAFGKLLEDRQAPPSYYHTVTREALDEPVSMNVYVLEWITSARGDPQFPSVFQLCMEKDERVWVHGSLNLDNLAIQKAMWHD